MRILIDLQACQSSGSRHRGIGRYSLALAQAMARNGGGHDLHLMLNGLFSDSISDVRQAFDGLVSAENMHVWHSPGPVSELDQTNRWRSRSGEFLREQAFAQWRPDFVHVSSLFEGLTDDALTSIHQNAAYLPTAVTLYDLIPLINANPYLENEQVRAWYYRKVQALKRADVLLAISSSSRQEGIDWLHLPPERVVNISSAVDERFCVQIYSPDVLSSLRNRYRLSKPFVMYTGGIDLRKNIEALIRSFAALPDTLRRKFQLAIVCSVQAADRERLENLARASGLQDGDMVLTGFVPDEDLPLLYHACHLFVFPSWHEGFGLPALEAMACGAPVIAANTSSLPEVVGRADALFDPRSESSITQKLYQALTDEDFCENLRRHGVQQAKCFSWDASAKIAISVFEELYQRRQELSNISRAAIPQVVKPRLAYFSPLPPERSGIADYSAELLPELAAYYDIELIVDQEVSTDPWLTTNFPTRNWKWFDQHSERYQRVLYNFGNSVFHTYMLDMLMRHPGVVVLHDFFLSGVIAHLELTGEKTGIWSDALYHSHGYHALLEKKLADDLNEIVWKFPCNRPVLDMAEGVIVHSAYSLDLSHQWYGLGSTEGWCQIPHLRKLPLAMNRNVAREQLNLSDEEFLVCSFGILGKPKLNHLLLSAWLDSPLAKDEKCHLVFVGQNDAGSYGADLLKEIDRSGMSGRIHITGFADQDLFRRYLQAADAAVQLRGLSRGETSGTVLDCMAHAIPTIVNNNGSMCELPENALIKLDEHFSQDQLIEKLTLLRNDTELRQKIGHQSAFYIGLNHSPYTVGRKYFNAIEQFFAIEPSSCMHRTLSAIGRLEAMQQDTDLTVLAQCLALNKSQMVGRRLLFDYAEMQSQFESVTFSALLTSFIAATPVGWRIEGINQQDEIVRYATQAICAELDLPVPVSGDGVVELRQTDVMLQFITSGTVNRQNRSHLTGAFLSRKGIASIAIEVNLGERSNILNRQNFDELTQHWWSIIVRSSRASS